MKGNEIQTFVCEICMETALITQKFSHDPTCIHNICYMCIARHILAKINDNIAAIICPELDCGKTLNPLQCRPMIPSTIFLKWCDCLCRSSVSTSKSSYCPNPYCSELILDECGETTKKSTCPRCKRLFCFDCRVPWHAGFWCTERSQRRDANDVRFGLLLERMKWTRCPYCGQSVERTEGCRNIRCRCGKAFCHDCGSGMHIGRCGKETTGAIDILDVLFVFIFCCLTVVVIVLCSFS